MSRNCCEFMIDFLKTVNGSDEEIAMNETACSCGHDWGRHGASHPHGCRNCDCTTFCPLPNAVDHPAHYGGEKNPYEAIKVIRAHNLSFALGNALKYIIRAGQKNSATEIEDLKKAVWCIEDEIRAKEGHYENP